MRSAAAGTAMTAVGLSLLAAAATAAAADDGTIPPSGVDARDTSDFVIADVTAVQPLCQLTGPGAFNDTESVKVAGTDIGAMFGSGDTVWFAFGDTFGERTEGMIGGGGTIWRSNTLAFTRDDDPRDCIGFDGWITDAVGWAKELLGSTPPAAGEITVIPTHGFEIDDRLYLHYMSVQEWGAPGEWTTGHAGLARSVDGGKSWERLYDVTWPGEGSFQEVSVARVDERLYFWGVPAGRLGGVSLMTVPVADVEDLDAYRYLSGLTADGQPQWSADQDDAMTIIDRPTGELSVIWDEGIERWLMTTMVDNRDAALYEGLAPWGPWGEPVLLLTQEELPGLYAPVMHPRYVSEDGRTIWFGLSEWLPYNVFWLQADLVLEDETVP